VTEIEIMKKLNHPHIVRFIDTYTRDNSVSILMSPVADFDLGYFLSKYQTLEPVPMDSIVQWFSCLVSSVEYLHGKSIKHQDIKPSNILVKGRTLFLADFGIAKTFVDTDSTVSTSGDMTRKYCSPETAQNSLRGRKADIFSLGCVFLEMFNLLIYQGQLKFELFQNIHFIGNGTYQENLPMVKLWIRHLQQEPIVEKIQTLRRLLDACEAMMEQSSKSRPSAADLFLALPRGQCCLSANNVSDSKSAQEEKQVVPADVEPTPHQNSPQLAPLDDQTKAGNEQSLHQGPPSSNVHNLFRPKIPNRSGILSPACSKIINWCNSGRLIKRITGCTVFSTYSIIMIFISALFLLLNLYHSPLLLKKCSQGPRVLGDAKVVERSRIEPQSSVRESTALLTYAPGNIVPIFLTSGVEDMTYERLVQIWHENKVSHISAVLES
jgi:serine/threonine protein kinase